MFPDGSQYSAVKLNCRYCGFTVIDGWFGILVMTLSHQQN